MLYKIQSVGPGEKWRCLIHREEYPYWERIYDGTTSFNLDQIDQDVADLKSIVVEDDIVSVGFQHDTDKTSVIDPVTNSIYKVIDNIQVYNDTSVKVVINGANPVGAFKIENQMNYHWDRPELKVLLYKNNASSESNYLGGFRIPYGWGSKVNYDLDNLGELNLPKGFWASSTYLFDWNEVGRDANREAAQIEVFRMAVANQNEYGTQLAIDLRDS